MPILPIRRDQSTSAFLDGTAEGIFLLVKDHQTGKIHEPQFDPAVDPERYSYIPSSGKGTVLSWSVVHQRTPSGTARMVVGIVELAEGPWWWTEIANADPDADLLGVKVQVEFTQLGTDTHSQGEHIPYFRII